MELTMTNSFGFCELNENEMMMVDGGATVGEAIVGTAGVVSLVGVAPTAALVAALGIFTAPAAVVAAPLIAVGSAIFGVCAIGNMITSDK